MTPQEKGHALIVTGTLGAAILLVVFALGWVVTVLAATLHEWSLTR